ncbi:MAG: molecular chaperone HscB [Candidatus Azotimanducaceae bacterium]|jgi:molecular chaperone HscB
MLVDFTQTYFQIFQLDTSFQIDQEVITQRFHELQLSVHPDKFVTSTDQEKRLAVQWSTQINLAFDTLKNPLLRAIYLLSLKDIQLEANPNLSPTFLMSQVELRETLEDIEALGEPGLDKLDQFKKEIKSSMQSVELEFNKIYNAENAELEATQLVYQLQFTNKLLIAANQVEEKLLDY